MCEFAVQGPSRVLYQSLSLGRCDDPMRDLQISVPVEWPPLHLLRILLHGWHGSLCKSGFPHQIQ